MALIHYYVHGRGRGHASRSRTVIDRLHAAGHEVVAFAGAAAVPLLRERTATHGVRSILPDAGLGAPALVAARVREALAALRHDRAALTVSDGDLPGLIAARIGRRPSIAVGHGLVFYCCTRPPELPAAPWRREAVKAAVSTFGAHRRIAVNFTPLPVRRGRLARPGLELPTVAKRTPSGPLLCYFRDGPPRALLQRVARLHSPVILFATTDPAIAGVVHEPPSRERFVEILARAQAVIASAGSQLISECVALGTPLFATFARDDDEQALNVAMLRCTGLGGGCPVPELDDARLRAFLDRATPQVAAKDIASWDAPDVPTAVLEEVDELLEGSG